MVATEMFKIVESAYGKTGVKMLHVSKEGSLHTIRELEVVTLLTLNNNKDYETGDNSDIIATDSQKNTVYVLAKQYGVSTPESLGFCWPLILCQSIHGLSRPRFR